MERYDVSTPGEVLDLQAWNEQMARLAVEDRIQLAYDLFGEDLVLATSFGPTSGVMLSLAASVCPSIRVVTVRHGHETQETLDFADELCRKWPLDLRIYRGENLSIPDERSEAFARFQFKAKILPFRQALRTERARAWLSGVMRSESPARRDFDSVMIQNGLPVFYPILDWSLQRIDAYYQAHGIPQLTYYFDPTKGMDQDLECGLHRGPDDPT